MPSSVIGSLRVNLGIDTAAFGDGLKSATGKLSGFGASFRKVIIPLAAVATAALAGLAAAVKGAINTADEMGKAAQKFGIPVEELSRLKYAADLSDVSLQTLGTSVSRLSRNMSDAAQKGTGQAADAFKRLGIEVTNADGSLRSSNHVLAEISDRFAIMPDGAEKTALALQLMGRSGAEMIPLINGGSEALGALEDEAERLGLVITQDAANAADRFNDSLDRLGAASRGIAQQIATDLTPMLEATAYELELIALNSRNVGAIASEVFGRLVPLAQAAESGLRAVALGIQASFRQAFANILSAAAATFEAITGLGSGLRDMATMADVEAGQVANRASAAASNAAQFLNDARASLESIVLPMEAASVGAREFGEALTEAAGGGGRGGGGAQRLSDSLAELKSRAEQVFSATRTPQEEFGTKMAELNELVRAGLIDMDTYARAVTQAQDELAEFGKTGESAFSNLGDSFGDAVADIVQGTSSIGEAFDRMFSQIAGNLISSGISNALGGAFKHFGLGDIFGQIPGFARGTNFAPGGLAMVGEHGAELVDLPRGSRVIPNHKLGGGDVTVIVNNAPAGTTVQESRGADGRRIIEIAIKEGMKTAFARGEMDSTMRRCYGLNRQQY